MPANGTAGFARSAVSGISRLPSPPARTIARTFLRGARRSHGGQRSRTRGRFGIVRVDVLTREYPPEVYGGAGVHVAELVRALRARADVEAHVHAFGAPRDEPLHLVVRRPRRAVRRQRGAAHARRRPGDRRRLRRHRPGALAHLVRQLRRPPRLAAARRPARRVRALARAAAAVEGRAARRRLRGLVVRRADVVRGGGRRHRGVGGDARRRARVVPLDRPGARARRPQRHRHRRLVAARRPRPGARAGRRPGPAVGRVRRPDHPAEGAAALPARVRRAAARGPGRAVRRRAGHPGDRGRGRGPGRRAARHPRPASSGSPRCSRAPTSSRC